MPFAQFAVWSECSGNRWLRAWYCKGKCMLLTFGNWKLSGPTSGYTLLRWPSVLSNKINFCSGESSDFQREDGFTTWFSESIQNVNLHISNTFWGFASETGT